MTSEMEQRPTFIRGGYGRLRRQWVSEKVHLYGGDISDKQSARAVLQMSQPGMNLVDYLPVKLTIETSIIKFWIHLQGLPGNNIAKQCFQLSKEMADKNQTRLLQKVDQLCIKYYSSSITLNENNEKLSTSHSKQNIRKALTAHQ